MALKKKSNQSNFTKTTRKGERGQKALHNVQKDMHESDFGPRKIKKFFPTDWLK